MKVIMGSMFAQYFLNFPRQDQEQIRAFVKHVELYGLNNLKGRNKSSDHVPHHHSNWSERVAYAQKHKLWHYHIGIPNYEITQNGEYVSEYILHYIREENEIKLVALSYHPPFELPSEQYLH